MAGFGSDPLEQIRIFDLYYPDCARQLSIYQCELLGTMLNLKDCESAIRYAAGNGIRARSIDKIVNQVYLNREWEREQLQAKPKAPISTVPQAEREATRQRRLANEARFAQGVH